MSECPWGAPRFETRRQAEAGMTDRAVSYACGGHWHVRAKRDNDE